MNTDSWEQWSITVETSTNLSGPIQPLCCGSGGGIKASPSYPTLGIYCSMEQVRWDLCSEAGNLNLGKVTNFSYFLPTFYSFSDWLFREGKEKSCSAAKDHASQILSIICENITQIKHMTFADDAFWAAFSQCSLWLVWKRFNINEGYSFQTTFSKSKL